MALNLRRLGILVAVTAVLLLGVVLVAVSYTDVGMADIVGVEGSPLAIPDLSVVPESVAEDAAELGMELFGDYGEKYNDFVNQLVTTYLEAKDKDFVVIFNPGGWGWNLLESSPGWRSISNGIETELDSMGYTSLLLDYRRTKDTWRGIVDEFVEVLSIYPSKAENLAHRVEFLTSHIPELKVIVAGESDGTVISDGVMHILQNNPQVYSIQTGPPFWHKSVIRERTLVLDDNGMHPDTFTRGDISAMIWTSLEDLFGIPQPVENSGRVLFFLRAPGHDYHWRYPAVSSRISSFLENNFGFKQG